MTQLFDTSTYDTPADGLADYSRPPRHLHSVSLDERRIGWRLDEQTIEVGRRGIARARAALKDSGKTTANQRRKAA